MYDLTYTKKWTDSTMYAAYILRKTIQFPSSFLSSKKNNCKNYLIVPEQQQPAMVSKFYRGLEVKNKNTAGALGTELYKLIWQPLEPYLKGVKKVSYSPAGKLYSIAFHALPVDSTTVLMDKYQLQQYTSTRQVVLREQENQNSKPQNIALFGDASIYFRQFANSKRQNKNRKRIIKYLHSTKPGNKRWYLEQPARNGTRSKNDSTII
ncbi:MAG: CHAT domain-containing protein [Chitinophagaceae bacterium]|nr:CHAT domain-containing protein [Chitinophagaceae bacterium]